MDYSSSELMIVNAARLLKNGDVVFVRQAKTSAFWVPPVKAEGKKK